VYKPGVTNVVADAMSRWAYPASTQREDVSIHGSADSAAEVKNMEQPYPHIMSIYKTEDYKLDPLVRNQALIKLGVTPSQVKVDLFASFKNTQEKVFIDKDMDAFSYDWSQLCQEKNDILWANPPFSRLEEVVTKAITEKCKMVLCVPVWVT
jgi:hypothetical protein